MTNKLFKKSSGDESSTKAVAVPDKKELQKYTPSRTREIIVESVSMQGDVDRALKRFGDDILPKYIQGDKSESEKTEKEFKEEVTELMYGLEVDTHWGLMESFDQRYRGLAKELSSKIIEEYCCTTAAEKMLAETVAGTSIRFLDSSRRFNNVLAANSDITANLTGFLAMMSKQMDRTHRQYLSALMTLKQLKAPNIEMNIRAKTAFVSQNQQINAPQQSNETNESK